MEKRYDVFISYSTKDQKVVEGICGFLEREGYRCFVAYRDIPRGVVWASAITEALDASKMMVVVFSSAFNMSKQTDREIEIASENQMPILTYRVADAKMTGAKKYYLQNLNWIDAFPNPENYFGRLLDSVVKLIGPSKIVADKAAQEEAERLAKEEAERKSREAAERERVERERKAEETKRKAEQEHRGRERSEAQRKTEQEKANQVKIFDDSQFMPRKKLWLALGAMVVLVLLLVLLWPRPKPVSNPEPVPTDPTLAEIDSMVFHDCLTVADYRNYIAEYGQGAQHYAEAKGFIDRYVADSLQHVVDSLAQAQAQQLAQQQMEAEAKAKAEAVCKEDEAYRKCTTISGCNSYLKTYPNGRYTDQVRAKKAELEQKQAQQQTQQQTAQNTPTGETSNGSTTGFANGHEWVDLGLPSGTLWATCNLGASKPEDYGNYYAWGETSTKSTYNWDTYKYANGNYDKLTKYCIESDYGNNGFTDNLTTLESGDDPATANWGNGWQTPSKAQWDELLSNTTKTWTTRNGVQGRLFTSKKNGQTVFLPAAGCWDGELRSAVSTYWSRTLCANYLSYAWNLRFNSDFCLTFIDIRRYGQSVRPVRYAR